MAKAMLIMDMPSNCNNCPLRISISNFVLHSLDITNFCGKTKKVLKKLNEKPTWCPLRSVPQKKTELTMFDIGEAKGYNACIDEILGGGE